LFGFLILACSAPPDETAAPDSPDTHAPVAELRPVRTTPLDAPALLRRLSLDLRGDLPTLDELDAVEADPAALDPLVDEMLESPAFEQRFADLVAERWLTRVDVYNVAAVDLGLDQSLDDALTADVGNEVPVLLAAIAAEDLPWTEVVLADWTMTTDLLASVWPLEDAEGRDSGIDGWRRARYTDDRPAGGVVMTNGMWWRYWSAPNNYNRTRAAAIGRLLLCDDWLLRPVEIDTTVSLTGSLDEAVRTAPSCVACHDTLDPLAASLFGFWWFDLYDPLEMKGYHAERELLGPSYLGVEPAYFGKSLEAPAALGPRIAEDPRFLRCAVQQTTESFLRRPLDPEDFTTVTALQSVFEAEELKMRALVRAIVALDEYRAGGLLETAADDDPAATRRVVQPSQLARMMENATGYTWTFEGLDLLTNDELGYRVLAGGVDGLSVTLPNEEPAIPRAAVMLRLAEAASSYVAMADFDLPQADRRLLTVAEPDDRPEDAAFAEQLSLLHRRLHGRDATEEELAEELALASEMAASGAAGPELWQALIELLLRDPAFWTY
jgi:hypothetical protein